MPLIKVSPTGDNGAEMYLRSEAITHVRKLPTVERYEVYSGENYFCTVLTQDFERLCKELGGIV